VLPRGTGSSGGALAVLVSAAIASSVIVGGAYAVLYRPAPALTPTPTQPLTATWQLDQQLARATVAGVVQGPALAAPSIEQPGATLEQQESGPLPPSSAPEVIIDDRYQLRSDQLPAPPPEVMPAVPETEPKPETPPVPYPNPTTTPPDAIGPELDLEKATPGLDPENPYRD
jgi:hypothetical protein